MKGARVQRERPEIYKGRRREEHWREKMGE